MTVKMNPLLKQFYLFLEKHNARMAWENNRITKYPNMALGEFFHEIELDSYWFILAAFAWSNTPEGHTYWEDLHSKWFDERNR